MAAGLMVLIVASFSNVAYERLPLDEEDEEEATFRIQPPVSKVSVGVGVGGGGGSGFLDPSCGFPFLNLPMANNCQLLVDNWVGNSARLMNQ
ncbi:AT-hook motif nuclear-localized protein 21 [Camellia lanceoleosa]|uniref:AT-hook motif nuclear-localized protein 21 n=1 Tax=Camellia lanceoleosa TaxID=1840588 RepID=A0ACC0G4T4_9ERIC|nr:AT-hook motif nuclear-localized protein 21 [Camellia lanceoleosa]